MDVIVEVAPPVSTHGNRVTAVASRGMGKVARQSHVPVPARRYIAGMFCCE